MLPASTGTYILILHLSQPAQLTIGRAGLFVFPAGYYAYVGSAFGPGGLRARLKHHLAPPAKPHWHIDYLRPAAPLCELWHSASTVRREHQWAALLCAMPAAALPAPRFGASDCTCASHLVHFPHMPDAAPFSGITRFPVPAG